MLLPAVATQGTRRYAVSHPCSTWLHGVSLCPRNLVFLGSVFFASRVAQNALPKLASSPNFVIVDGILLERGLEPLHLNGTSTSSLRVYQFHHPSAGLQGQNGRESLGVKELKFKPIRISFESFYRLDQFEFFRDKIQCSNNV